MFCPHPLHFTSADIGDISRALVGRVLDLLGLDNNMVKRWAGANPKRK